MSVGLNPVSVNVNISITATETITPAAGDVNPPNGQAIPHNGFNYSATGLNSSSGAWPQQGCSYQNYQLASGTLTIDLTNLKGFNGAAIDGTGKQVREIIINVPGGNGHSITITPGASNGYNLFGASFSVTYGPGQVDGQVLANSAPVVGPTAKTLLLTGTGSSDSVDIGFVFG